MSIAEWVFQVRLKVKVVARPNVLS